ncbi:MAG TPA: response regulator [Spirochaetales bacterium]|nr:response regulator [Spirochaetales bacterium]HPB65817.1 response regulator [Spirochaetales bacterium]HPG85338.1 response regulator [Spirochaetales bacterium]HPM72617.1 response regulator [Spirochaetales bacterium]
MKSEAILCVDDEAIILMAMKRELKTHFRDRFRFETALDAAEGLRIIDALSEDGVSVILVISDWLMPGMKGDEFLLRIRSLHPDIRTIMVTGHADPASIERTIKEAGAFTVLQKPWNRGELIAAISACVGPERSLA